MLIFLGHATTTLVAGGNQTGDQTEDKVLPQTPVLTIDSLFRSPKFIQKKIDFFREVNIKTVPDRYIYEIRKSGFYRYIPDMSKNNRRASEECIVSAETLNRKIKSALGIPKNYIISHNKSKVLFLYETQKIYRFSFEYYAVVWDIEKDTGYILGVENKISNAEFSPDDSKVAYIMNNNLYYFDLETGKHITITTDGEEDRIIKGRLNYLYEEEFLYVAPDFRGYIWSPDSKTIAFLRLDQSDVKDVLIDVYSRISTVPNINRYPVAGEIEARVSVNVYNMGDTLILPVAFRKGNDLEYVFNMEWSGSHDEFFIYTLNRMQNDFKVYAVAVPSSFSRLIYNEKDDSTFVTYNKKLMFEDDTVNQRYFVVSDRDGYNKIYFFNTYGTPLKLLTSGKYYIDKIYGIDKKRNRIYFQAAYSKPYNREILSVDFEGNDLKIVAPEVQNRKDGWSEAFFSRDFSEMLISHSGFGIPRTYYHYVITDTGETLVSVMEDNLILKEAMEEYSFVRQDISVLKTDKMQDSLYYWIMKPEKIEKGKKYPVLFWVYGGPQIQIVRSDCYYWEEYRWHQYLVSQGYIVICVEGRGTPGRSAEFEKCVYMRLGELEAEDQINAARYFATLPYIDSSRMAIWGWSFGGYLASLCIFNDNSPFKLAMAMSPVSDWRFYDNIYTEHYMGTPQENKTGYDQSSLLNKTSKLKGKYLLGHGTSDDNVHFRNTMALISALKKEGKLFDLLIFQNQNHILRGGNAEEILYKKMTEFLRENL
ncbi:MAG: DPP IV N-terminal domain-containing protein [Bacteroidales bacterium]|nr:DPP IV N-terminal domain-containing protein [Bacteroidales bacterium]